MDTIYDTLLALIRTEEPIPGVSGEAERFAQRAIEKNRTLAVRAIHALYFYGPKSRHVKIGILNIIAHIEYRDGILANFMDIAIDAMGDQDEDVRDYGRRCFEYWAE